MFGIGTRKLMRSKQSRKVDINKGSDTRIRAHVKNRKPSHIKKRVHKIRKASERYERRGHIRI